MVKKIQDNGFDEALLDLVKEVFELNKVKYDPTDYVPTKVSAAFKIPGLVKHNSIMQLSPLTSNMRRPNLKLYYDREDINEVLEPYGPFLRHIDPNANTYSVIDDLNKCLGGQLILNKVDFYDTYVATGEFNAEIDLHAQPNSYFYYGGCKIPVIDHDKFVLTFDFKPLGDLTKFKPTGMTLAVRRY